MSKKAGTKVQLLFMACPIAKFRLHCSFSLVFFFCYSRVHSGGCHYGHLSESLPWILRKTKWHAGPACRAGMWRNFRTPALHALVYSHLHARFSRTTYSIILFLTFNKNFTTYLFIQLKYFSIRGNYTKDRKPRWFGTQGGRNDINPLWCVGVFFKYLM